MDTQRVQKVCCHASKLQDRRRPTYSPKKVMEASSTAGASEVRITSYSRAVTRAGATLATRSAAHCMTAARTSITAALGVYLGNMPAKLHLQKYQKSMLAFFSVESLLSRETFSDKSGGRWNFSMTNLLRLDLNTSWLGSWMSWAGGARLARLGSLWMVRRPW